MVFRKSRTPVGVFFGFGWVFFLGLFSDPDIIPKCPHTICFVQRVIVEEIKERSAEGEKGGGVRDRRVVLGKSHLQEKDRRVQN